MHFPSERRQGCALFIRHRQLTFDFKLSSCLLPISSFACPIFSLYQARHELGNERARHHEVEVVKSPLNIGATSQQIDSIAIRIASILPAPSAPINFLKRMPVCPSPALITLVVDTCIIASAMTVHDDCIVLLPFSSFDHLANSFCSLFPVATSLQKCTMRICTVSAC